MTFDSIPEDRELSFPCACGGNIKEHNGEWECDSCDWKWDYDDCGRVSDLIDAPVMISAWSSGDANYSIRSGVDMLKCTALDSSHMAAHLEPSDNAEELSTAPTNDNHRKITQKNENRRVGRFEISRKLIEERPNIVRSIMGRCIVIRCETMYYTDAIEYTALSPDFDEVPEGKTIPRYVIEVSENGDVTHIEFKCIDKQ